MKFVILLCALSALLLQTTYASPVNVVERQSRAVSRQQATGTNEVAPAAVQSSDDDDDDEDDDDDPDLGDLVDDDDDDDDDEEDDDDDEEDDTPQGQAAPAPGAAAAGSAASAASDDDEDDDDDDYLDRLFDDILGDDDDEDEDDDVVPAANVQNTIASNPAAPIEDIEPIAQQSSVSTGISDGVDLPAENANIADPAPVGNSADEVPSSASASSNNEGGLKNNVIDMSSDAFQERHNQFIDSIFTRINRIVADNYDPFVVRLNTRPALKDGSGSSSSATKTLTTIKAKSSASKAIASTDTTKKLKNTKSEPKAFEYEMVESTAAKRNADPLATVQVKLQEQLQQLQNLKSVNTEQRDSNQISSSQNLVNANPEAENSINIDAGTNAEEISKTLDETTAEVRTDFTNESAKSVNIKKSSTKVHKYSTKKASAALNTQNTIQQNQKQKQKQGTNSNSNSISISNSFVKKTGNVSGKDVEKLQKAEGSLSGLASLKRVGNVKVTADPEGRNSTIKAKFTLGPLLLRVEKSFKRGSVRSVKSATARTNEMIGRIKFSVVDDHAMLMSIKVQQPKQVEVESKDNHDRTREFIWRRTPKIAKLVNEKLKLAAESLFTPQGVQVVKL